MNTNEPAPRSRLRRLTFLGQVAFNITLLCAVFWLGFGGGQRGLLFVPMVLILFLPYSYARLRLQRVVEQHAGKSAAWLLAVLGVGFDAVIVVQLLNARGPTIGSKLFVTSGLPWAGPVWYSAHLLLFLGYSAAAVVRGVTSPLRRRFAERRPTVDSTGDLMLARRELLQRGGLVAATLPFGISLSSVSLSYDFRVERHEVVLPHWPRELDGLTIAHLSDIHVGGSMNRERLRRVAELTNAARPDLVIHTGDFLTHRLGDFDAPLYEALSRMHAPYGQWACLGNHDFDDVNRLVRRLGDCSVRTLRDQNVAVVVQGQQLEMSGVDFQFRFPGRAASYDRILSSFGERRAVPRILLNHDPTTFHGLPENCADVVLSGHLHGGQVGVQLSSTSAITVVGLAGLPDQGIFSRGDMRMYVTRGVGFYGYPMRIGIPPEIALLVLRSQAAV